MDSTEPPPARPQYHIRRAEQADLPALATLNALAFLGNRGDSHSSRDWVTSWMKAEGIYHYFLLVVYPPQQTQGEIAGYISWQLHGGFLRAQPVIELEQLTVADHYKGYNFGAILIEETRREMTNWILGRNNRIESHIAFVVWCYAHNLKGLATYSKTFADGVVGMRTMYGDRTELMYRHRVPMVREYPAQ